MNAQHTILVKKTTHCRGVFGCRARWLPLAMALLLAVLDRAVSSPLTIYSGQNETGTAGFCNANQIYAGSAIPNGLNDNINSFQLNKGYGVVFGVNNDNVGPGKCWVAYTGDRYQNIPANLQNSISFIRVFPIDTAVQKKGFAGINNNALGDAVNATWFYDWGLSNSTTATMEYCAMKWGGGNMGVTNYLKTKPVANLLTFNEPDNTSQANMTVSTALTKYQQLLPCGLRMGSPVCQQDNYKTWLLDFMNQAKTLGLRVDFICDHWYGYGFSSVRSGAQLSSDMQAKIINLQQLCGNTNMNVWITEYNIHGNNTNVQANVDFITNSATWINNTSWLERHSFLQSDPYSGFGTATALSPIGQAYQSAPTVNSPYGGINNLGY